jgi:hypothetical protein
MNVAHIPGAPPNPADDNCPCNTNTAQTAIPTLMGQTIHIDACTTWGVGLSIRDDEDGDGGNTQLSVGQAQDLARALTTAANAIEQAVTA